MYKFIILYLISLIFFLHLFSFLFPWQTLNLFCQEKLFGTVAATGVTKICNAFSCGFAWHSPLRNTVLQFGIVYEFSSSHLIVIVFVQLWNTRNGDRCILLAPRKNITWQSYFDCYKNKTIAFRDFRVFGSIEKALLGTYFLGFWLWCGFSFPFLKSHQTKDDHNCLFFLRSFYQCNSLLLNLRLCTLSRQQCFVVLY